MSELEKRLAAALAEALAIIESFDVFVERVKSESNRSGGDAPPEK